MYIKINKKKIPIYKKETLKDKIVSFRFKLDEINYGIYFEKKRRINTYFYCQNVDIIMTNKENIITSIFINQQSEKRFKGKKRTYFIYVMPKNSCKDLHENEKLKILEK